MLSIGEQAPDFTLPLSDGGSFTLSEHRGKNVVLYFYPKAFTLGCTLQTRGFRDAYGEFDALNAIIVGISTDAVDTVQRFQEACGTPFALASDASGEARRLYDVARRFHMGTSRVTYVIDGEGVVRGAFHDELVMSHHISHALRALEALG